MTKEKPCAHCPATIKKGESHAIVIMNSITQVPHFMTFDELNVEVKGNLVHENPPKKTKSKLYLCEDCMHQLNKRVADGTLGENEEDTWEMQAIDEENGVLTKDLIDWHIPYDAFFQCQAIRSYIGLVTGTHEKWGLDLEWMRRNTYKKKRHFNLKGLLPGSMLKIRGIRNNEDVIRYIIVIGVEKHVLFYKTLSEEQVVLAVSDPNLVEV